MKFSIIIPCWNEAKTIQPCLLALQGLRHESELILVDGGSTDDTIEIGRPLVDKTLICTKGRARQMNNGAKQATGEMLIFLHADTFLPNDALALIRQQLSQKQSVWGRFNIRLKGKPIMLKLIATLMNWRSRLTGIATGDQVIFVDKALFHQVGGYSDIALMEDINLSVKLKKISSPTCLKAKVTSSGRRWEKFGVVKTILLMWSIRLRYFFGENPENLVTLYTRGQFWKT